MSAHSLVLDLAALLVIALCALYYSRRGFISGLLSFFGTLIALVCAGLAARWLAPAAFDAFLRQGMERSVAESIAEHGITTVGDLLQHTFSFLPPALLQAIELTLGVSLDFGAADIAVVAVDQVLKPVVVPLLSIVLFFLLFAFVRVLIGAIRSLSLTLSRIPAIGAANHLLGAIVGVFIGVLYVYLVLSAIWAYDRVNPQTPLVTEYFSRSIVVSVLEPLNIFARI